MFSNRAEVYLRIFCIKIIIEWDDCIQDCQTSIQLDPKFSKSYFRLGKAY
jgi:hypothetical protein